MRIRIRRAGLPIPVDEGLIPFREDYLEPRRPAMELAEVRVEYNGEKIRLRPGDFDVIPE